MEKKCNTCKQHKPLSAFYKIANGKDGVRPQCKECTSKREKEKYANSSDWREDKIRKQREKRETDPEFKAAHRARCRRWHLKHTYGLSEADYLAMVEKQNGRCAICGELPEDRKARSSLVVDHCHSTGVVRGLLCDLCNTAIGKFNDDYRLVEKAAKYLRLTSSTSSDSVRSLLKGEL